MKRLLLLTLLFSPYIHGMQTNLDSPALSDSSDMSTPEEISSSLSLLICGRHDQEFVKTFEKILKRKAKTIEQEQKRAHYVAIVMAISPNAK